MGCANSGLQTSEEEAVRHRRIEKEMRSQQKALATESKILLLGAGDTGKSTLVKQIKLIYKRGFTNAEREIFRDIIATNMLVWMHTLISAVGTMELQWKNPDNDAASRRIVQRIEDQSLPSLEERFSILIENKENILLLWDDPAIQAAYAQAHTFQLGESARYFFESLERVAVKNYLPNDEDVLFARARTSGVAETTFETDGRYFRVVDVGGQRSERRKWIHCFQEVTTIIFFAALSEYNLGLYEERAVNRMKESLKLFDEIVNCVWFKDTPVILFLNKCDLFADKLKKFPLSDYFSEYSGGDDYAAGCEFITKMFKSLNQNQKRTVYPHITCCTDTKMVKKLMGDVRDVVLRGVLAASFNVSV